MQNKTGRPRVGRRERSFLCGRHTGLLQLEETREWGHVPNRGGREERQQEKGSELHMTYPHGLVKNLASEDQGVAGRWVQNMLSGLDREESTLFPYAFFFFMWWLTLAPMASCSNALRPSEGWDCLCNLWKTRGETGLINKDECAYLPAITNGETIL